MSEPTTTNQGSGIVVPLLQPESSALARAFLAERYFSIWGFEAEGPHALSPDLKTELDNVVTRVIELNSDDSLVEAAVADPMLGADWAKGKAAERPGGDVRAAAIHQIERSLAELSQDLERDAILSPAPTNIVYSTIDGLWDRLDNRQLFPLLPANVDTEQRGDDRYVLIDEWAVFPHPSIRQNRELIGGLMKLALDGESVRLAIDPHRILPKEDRLEIMLRDFWYGIQMDREKLDDPNAVGHTQHARRKDTFNALIHPEVLLDITWQVDGDLKSLFVSETRAAVYSTMVREVVVNHSLHAQRNMKDKQWIHVDGAVKAYAGGTYEATIDFPTAPLGEQLAYRKLWRLDGEIGDDLFGALLSYNFRGNDLVAEAFDAI